MYLQIALRRMQLFSSPLYYNLDMSSTDDSGLILLAAQGDRDAFGEIVRSYRRINGRNKLCTLVTVYASPVM